MREIVGDLFDSTKADAICITTNGYVSENALAVMGLGCARQARDLWPGLDYLLGCLFMESCADHVRVLTEEVPVLFDGIMNPCGPDPTLMTGPWTGRNHVLPYHLVTFPTKPVICSEKEVLPRYTDRRLPADHWLLVPEQTYPEHIPHEPAYAGWMARSSLDLIRQSAQELEAIATERKWESVVLPRPGCGAGELSWDEVRPALSEILDDRFHAITFK